MARQDYLVLIISQTKKNALFFFFKYKEFMKKKGHTPIIRVKNPEPNINDPDWVIWQPGLAGSHLKKLKKNWKDRI